MNSDRESKTKPISPKIYLLPNLFTTGNMFCGFISIILGIQGNFSLAPWIIIVGAFFDSMDGRVARLTRSTSSFGVEYDSLADLITFGMAPAFLAYLWSLQTFGRLGAMVSFLYLTCSALRLARFNVMAGTAPKGFFTGLPSPMAAGVVATSVLFYNEMGLEFPRHWIAAPCVLLAATLMVSTVHFPSFKEFKLSRENSFGILALVVLLTTLIVIRPEVTLFLLNVFYILLSRLADLVRLVWGKRKPKGVPSEQL